MDTDRRGGADILALVRHPAERYSGLKAAPAATWLVAQYVQYVQSLQTSHTGGLQR